jgi:hypothetical protein
MPRTMTEEATNAMRGLETAIVSWVKHVPRELNNHYVLYVNKAQEGEYYLSRIEGMDNDPKVLGNKKWYQFWK